MPGSEQRHIPLEEVMVAMDVVDTLRHRSRLVDRELNEDARREKLIEKLKEIYASQGIEVTDALLEEGVRAMEEDRFAYEPTKPSFKRWLAHKYISRGSKRSKPFLIFCGAALFMVAINFFTEVLPERRLAKQLPDRVESLYETLTEVSVGDAAKQQKDQLYRQATAALNSDDAGVAEDRADDMAALLEEVQNEYQLRVINEPGEQSGVWRIPDVNEQARNYYLIVDAVDSRGTKVRSNVFSEESNSTKELSRWGLRVSEADFKRVSEDKMDDGIIQNSIVGNKKFGYITVDYSVFSDGSAIHEW